MKIIIVNYIFITNPIDTDRDFYFFIADRIFIDPNRDLCLLCIIPVHYTVFEIVTRAPPGQALAHTKPRPASFYRPA